MARRQTFLASLAVVAVLGAGAVKCPVICDGFIATAGAVIAWREHQLFRRGQPPAASGAD